MREQAYLHSGERTYDVLGVPIRAIQIAGVIEAMERWIGERGPARYVTFTNVHAVMEAHRNAAFRGVLNQAAAVCPDGMPLVWLGRLHGYEMKRRVYGPDLLWDFCEATQQQGYSHYFYGGAPGVAERLAKRLSEAFPKIRIAGYYSPPYRELTDLEKVEVVRQISEARPDVLWVGLGCPKQEFWMHEFSRSLPVPVILGVGQAFDIYAGNLRQAPRFMREHGFEWLFRLCSEPRRLWKRYLIYNVWFLSAVVRRALASRT